MFNKDYRVAHRDTNKRNISLEETLGDKAPKLREFYKQARKAPYLGPDTKEAFVNIVLTLYEDPRKYKTNQQIKMMTAWRRQITRCRTNTSSVDSLFAPLDP